VHHPAISELHSDASQAWALWLHVVLPIQRELFSPGIGPRMVVFGVFHKIEFRFITPKGQARNLIIRLAKSRAKPRPYVALTTW